MSNIVHHDTRQTYKKIAQAQQNEFNEQYTKMHKKQKNLTPPTLTPPLLVIPKFNGFKSRVNDSDADYCHDSKIKYYTVEIDFACVKSLLDFKLELFQQFYSLLVEQFKGIDSFIV